MFSKETIWRGIGNNQLNWNERVQSSGWFLQKQQRGFTFYIYFNPFLNLICAQWAWFSSLSVRRATCERMCCTALSCWDAGISGNAVKRGQTGISGGSRCLIGLRCGCGVSGRSHTSGWEPCRRAKCLYLNRFLKSFYSTVYQCTDVCQKTPTDSINSSIPWVIRFDIGRHVQRGWLNRFVVVEKLLSKWLCPKERFCMAVFKLVHLGFHHFVVLSEM